MFQVSLRLLAKAHLTRRLTQTSLYSFSGNNKPKSPFESVNPHPFAQPHNYVKEQPFKKQPENLSKATTDFQATVVTPLETASEANTAENVLSKNAGMNQFINRVYQLTGISMTASLAIGYGLVSATAAGLIGVSLESIGIAGACAIVGGFLGTNAIKPIPYVEDFMGTKVHKTRNPALRLASYITGVVGIGMGIAPLMQMCMEISATIVPTSIGITAAIFGGATLMAGRASHGSLLSLGRPLFGSLLGLIGLQLLGIGGLYFVGPNPYSSFLFSIDNYGGIALFTGFMMYDTHLAMKRYEKGDADHLGVSVELILDIWNVLVRIMEILAKKKK